MLFAEAVDAAPEARAALLARVAAEDPLLHEELAGLLGAHEGDGPVGRLDAPVPRSKGRVGPYQLLEVLGVGGMGVVYLAEREGPDFTQRVALKLLRAGFADPRLEERLRRERRILARLEHPGIARFIDGGTTDTGQSFFAMEFVEGTTLLAACDARGLDTRDRVRLFLSICAALHYAHQQRVVHGDLKPSNILVTPDGQVKLLDFGIAELMDVTGAPDGATRSAPWLTPAYASPEQVRGQPLSILTDVYSLGVVLYELLAGSRPYEVERHTPAEVERIVCTREPPPPSTRVHAPRERRALAGDLDTIVLMALAKEPTRRYPSVSGLAADLTRYLDGEPIAARPASAGYRIGKFIRRHRVLAGASAAVFVSLVAGIGVAETQARRARVERDRAEEARTQAEAVSGFLIDLFDSSDPRRSGADTTVARAMLARGQAQADRLQGEPVLQARLYETLGRVMTSLGRFDEALLMQRRALALREQQLGASHPEVAASLEQVALSLRRLGRIPEADSVLDRALGMARATLGDRHPQVAHALLAKANVAVAEADLPAAEAAAREALAINQATLPPGDPAIAEALRVTGSVLNREGRAAEAEPYFRAYVDHFRKYEGVTAAATGEAMLHLADLYFESLDRPVAAESLAREGLGITQRALGPDHPALSHGRNSLAAMLSARGAFAEAESLLRVNLEVMTRAMGRESYSAAEIRGSLAEALRQQGRLRDASTAAESALAVYRRLSDPGDAGPAGMLLVLAQIRMDQGRGAEALRRAEEAIALRERVYVPDHPLIAVSRETLASLHARLGHRATADSLYALALQGMGRTAGPDHPYYRRIAAERAALRAGGTP